MLERDPEKHEEKIRLGSGTLLISSTERHLVPRDQIGQAGPCADGPRKRRMSLSQKQTRIKFSNSSRGLTF